MRAREVLARLLAGVCVNLALSLSYVFLDFYVLNRVRLSNPLRPSPLPKYLVDYLPGFDCGVQSSDITIIVFLFG